ncbi:MAG: hypothetical protein M3451_02105 [Chloroflexota bacterium]|nr:hypothetical protein [Chloroflexota bacterium]
MTNHDSDCLTMAQEVAISALIRGATVSAAAAEASVVRQTVSTWKNTNPAFIAALNRERRHVWEQEQDRVRAIRTKALEVIALALEGDGSYDRAIEVLKALSRLNDRPTGPTTPERVAG